MSALEYISQWRDWFPVPREDGRIHPVRWLLLEGHRYAVTGALLTFVFVVLMLTGSLWTFEMQRLLYETPAVQTVLSTFLSGIILLVSIVVSINSIILSHDITSVQTQENRIEGIMEFRRELGAMTKTDEDPVNPASFLRVMADVIRDRARALREEEEVSDALAEDISEFVETVDETIEYLNVESDRTHGADFGVLWKGLEFDYGPYADRSHRLAQGHGSDVSESFEEKLDDLTRAFQVFAIGKEYFKTLYYSREVSQLSRTLLVIALPSILATASTILAINAGVIPDISILGLPSLYTFVAVSFTISLAPYVVLTAYMLRLATVALETSSAGPFSLLQ
jgi:hypothetical protein